MTGLYIAAGVVGGIALLGGAATAGSFYGAKKLYNKVIPRQTECRVSQKEMGDMSQWEDYKVLIHERKDFLTERGAEHVTIKSRDDLTLHADLYSADGEADTLVVCCHGYTSTGWDSCAAIGAFFVKEGYDALIVDLRAHGKSEGDYVGFGILDRHDCLGWINYVNERFGGKKNILLYGVSMGAATVLMTTGLELPENVKGVIADCGFTSPYDVFAHIMKRDYHMSEFPVMNINDRMCKKNAGYGFREYSTLDAMKTNKVPVLFVHGAKDTFVPTEMSHRNYEACVAPKDILIVETASHAASYYEATEAYESKMREFISQKVGI